MQRYQKIIVLVVALSLISACGKNDLHRSRATEEAAVYSALINEQLEVPFSYLMGDPILIVNSTDYEPIDDDYLYASALSLDKDTLEDFKEVNKESQPLDVPLSLNKPYEYISLPNDNNGWIEFSKKYPKAISITSLSKIGLNKEFDQALVYMAYYCGNECGLDSIYFLVREGDIWRVESTVGRSVS